MKSGSGSGIGSSEEVTDLDGIRGGVVVVEDLPNDFLVGSLTQDAIDGDLFCPLVRSITEERIMEQVGMGAIHQVFDLADLVVEIDWDLPVVADLHGVSHGCLWLTLTV